jgi:hypothetical protein
MKPVKIRYFGILPMTRKLYLNLVVWGWIGVTLLLIVASFAAPGRMPPFRGPWESTPPVVNSTREFLYWHFYDLYFICLVAQVIDAAIMLRKYKAKQEEEERMAMKHGLDD